MKTSKRLLAVLLAILTLALLAAPASVASAKSALPKIEGLNIFTSKAKQITMTWNAISGVSGYEIWRSTTGKTGSYELITDVQKPVYTDTGLKHSKTYYYAVRAWGLDANGGFVYGPYKKANMSTRITKAYAAGHLVKAWKAMDKFVSAYDYESGKYIEQIRGDWYGFYFPFTLSGCDTMADAVNYLHKYFTKKAAKAMAKFYLKTINGELYIWLPQDPGFMGPLVINDVSVKKISYRDKQAVCKFNTWIVPAYSDEEDPELEYIPWKVALDYENGTWLFEDDGWYNFMFDYTTVLTPNDGRGPDEI